ncbi:MAG: esterase/lipase family protein [Pyrinomonadaceae bacterium]
MPTYPIILAHGIARFDFLREHFVQRLGLDDDSITDHLHYFRNIQSHLAPHGFDVHHTTVGFAESVGDRAAELKAEVERILLAASPHTKAHIIAHSMGGLDARHMIVDLGMAQRVCSLTTIGTPHLGSDFADWGREHRGEQELERLDRVIDLEGFLNLTSANCAEFNARAEPAEADNEVFYQTYACWEDERDRVFTPLQLAWEVIKHRAEGENDGLVSVTSQHWTTRLRGTREKEVGQHNFPVLGDHFNECGWWEAHQLSGKFRLGTLLNPLTAVRSLFDDRREYESQLKGTYLSIAEGLESRFPI